MRWRRLGRADAAAAAGLLREAHGRNAAYGVILPTATVDAAAVARALDGGAALLGADADDAKLAVLAALWPDGEIGWLAVRSGRSGRGLGDAALTAAEALAVSFGLTAVYLRTAGEHPWLGDWYRRRGYAEAAGAVAPARRNTGGACSLTLVKGLDRYASPVRPRCPWAQRDSRSAAYHDVEWGLWVENERDLFERLSLEVFQTGLSWRTVLTKRAALRDGLLDFEPAALAAADPAEAEARFLATDGVIRSPRKFAAIVHNARVVLELADQYGSFAAFLRAGGVDELETALRARCRYVGPSVARSFFESVGLVAPPHAAGCVGQEIEVAAPAGAAIAPDR